MRARRAAYLVLAAFLAFTVWEVAQHVWLMNLPVALYHMLSLTVDLLLVLLIVLTALSVVRRQARGELRRHAVQDAVVAALAQDLRPPLVSFLAQLRALQAAPPAGASEETGDLLKQTEARGAVVLDTIEDLVAMAKEGDEHPPRCAGLSLSQLAGQALEAFRTTAEEKDVALNAEVSPDLPSTCTAPEAVLRALSTLLAHALQTTPRGGEIALRVARDDHSDAIVLSVSDTGQPLLDHSAGLEDVMARHALVEMHYVQALADALGGSVQYQAKPGGNTFSLSLPARGAAI